MGFTDAQIKDLSAKLSAKHVRTREEGGKVLSYLEGWHLLAEANRIFGFEHWDRETVESRCVWEGAADNRKCCSYIARVRIKVRADRTIIVREGCGAGNGSGATPGEAHEFALKQAETDATKRAISTFGNVFGLALYDKDQKGVRHTRAKPSVRENPATWVLFGAIDNPISNYNDPVAFCSALREQLEAITDADALMSFWARNQDTVTKLRSLLPGLKTEKGQHYGEILSALYTNRLQAFAAEKQTDANGLETARPTNEVVDNVNVDKKQTTSPRTFKPSRKQAMHRPLLKGPLRRRDKAH